MKNISSVVRLNARVPGRLALLVVTFSLVPPFGSALMAQEQRILGKVDANRQAVVHGNINPRARPEFDQGPVDPSMKLGYITMAFKKSGAQQANLEQLLRQQRDPSSPLFRKWLTPEQYADRFGLNQSDIDKIVAWLKSGRFTILQVARGRDLIAFSGTAGQVETAFTTPIHREFPVSMRDWG